MNDCREKIEDMPDKSGRNISVVIQGPVVGKSLQPTEERWTYLAIQSVRKHLPCAEVILSTWKGTDIKDLNYDVLVLNDDPGNFVMNIDDERKIFTNNVNRQIVSTKEGILKATRQYVLKLRSDIILTGNGFIEYFDKFRLRCEEFKILEKRVLCLCSSISLKKSNNNDLRSLFYVCDWQYFGLKTDVFNIWDIKLDMEFCGGGVFKLHPEQYIWFTFLNKYHHIQFEHRYDKSDKDIYNKSILSVINNLVLIDAGQFNVQSFKYKDTSYAVNGFKKYSLCTHNDWKIAYNKFCGGECSTQLSFKESIEKIQYYCYRNIIKIYNKIFSEKLKIMIRTSFRLLTGRSVKGKVNRGDEEN